MNSEGARLGVRRRFFGRLFAASLAFLLAACASAPSTVYDLTAAQPPRGRPLHAQFRIADPVATLDLDSDRILVRSGITLALLPGGRWPQQLTSLFRARLIESSRTPVSPARSTAAPRPPSTNSTLDIRAFELDSDDLGGPCRGRRQDRRAHQRAHRRRRDLFGARPGALDRAPPRSWRRSTRPRRTS